MTINKILTLERCLDGWPGGELAPLLMVKFSWFTLIRSILQYIYTVFWVIAWTVSWQELNEGQTNTWIECVINKICHTLLEIREWPAGCLLMLSGDLCSPVYLQLFLPRLFAVIMIVLLPIYCCCCCCFCCIL